MVHRVVIIGSGPAGWTAAIYGGRSGLQPCVYEGVPCANQVPGGQLMFTTVVENFPGFPEGVLGPELMHAMKAQAERFGSRSVGRDILGVDFSKAPFELQDNTGEIIRTHSVIIATGARAKWLGLPNELRLVQTGGGVSACAVCDGPLPIFRGQELAVVGGGNSALEETNYLTQFAKKVFLIHRRNEFRGSRIIQDRVLGNPKVEVLWDTEVREIHGTERIESLTLENTVTRKESRLPVRGLFVAIGHKPNTEFLTNQIDTDSSGYILLTRSFRSNTSKEGVFAAGDVIDPYYRQAITSAGTGCMAALDAERWLIERGL